MKTLVIDTETSSLPNNNLPLDHPEQARILQLAAIMLDDELNECGVLYGLLKHEDNIVIHPGAQAVHGITLEKCKKYGMPVRSIMDTLFDLIQYADVVVAHNLQFDRKLVDTEFTLLNGANVPWGNKGYCTMLTLTPICRIPHKGNRAGYKWPKLEEALSFVFNEQIKDAHDALADCRGAARLYKWLKNLHKPSAPVLQTALE